METRKKRSEKFIWAYNSPTAREIERRSWLPRMESPTTTKADENEFLYAVASRDSARIGGEFALVSASGTTRLMPFKINKGGSE
jgi:hypothetical protein